MKNISNSGWQPFRPANWSYFWWRRGYCSYWFRWKCDSSSVQHSVGTGRVWNNFEPPTRLTLSINETEVLVLLSLSMNHITISFVHLAIGYHLQSIAKKKVQKIDEFNSKKKLKRLKRFIENSRDSFEKLKLSRGLINGNETRIELCWLVVIHSKYRNPFLAYFRSLWSTAAALQSIWTSITNMSSSWPGWRRASGPPLTKIHR